MMITHLSRGGFAAEELGVLIIMRGIEEGVDENAALGNGFQGSRSFVCKLQTNEKLQQDRRGHEKVITRSVRSLTLDSLSRA